jgi:hypothetical protein
MAESRNIYFVTWPDGKVDGHTLNVFSRDHAKKALILSWMPERIFGATDWLQGYILNRIWDGMVQKGFKVHHIETNETGVPLLGDGA